MASLEFVFSYRCRYCGEVFRDAITGNKSIADKYLLQTACNFSKKDMTHPGDKSIHFAANHTGLADLIGYEIRKGEP